MYVERTIVAVIDGDMLWAKGRLHHEDEEIEVVEVYTLLGTTPLEEKWLQTPIEWVKRNQELYAMIQDYISEALYHDAELAMEERRLFSNEYEKCH